MLRFWPCQLPFPSCPLTQVLFELLLCCDNIRAHALQPGHSGIPVRPARWSSTRAPLAVALLPLLDVTVLRLYIGHNSTQDSLCCLAAVYAWQLRLQSC